MTGFASSFGNSVLLGLPLALLVFGEEGALPFLLLLSVHGLTYFSVTTTLLEYGRHHDQPASLVLLRVAKGLATNPIVLGLAGGVLLNRLALPLPLALDRVLAYMQQSVTPCALFSLGVSLARDRIAGSVAEASFAAVLKLLVFPAAAGALAWGVFGLGAHWTMAVTLLAAQPVGVNVHLFAERYGAARELATTAVFLSTTASLVTLSALLLLFGWAF
jgi:predicted permease